MLGSLFYACLPTVRDHPQQMEASFAVTGFRLIVKGPRNLGKSIAAGFLGTVSRGCRAQTPRLTPSGMRTLQSAHAAT